MAMARCVPPRTPFVGSGRAPEGGQLATHKRDFLAHASGEEWHHCADQINMNPPLVTVGGDNVQEALENLEAAVGGTNTLEEVLIAGNQANGQWINLNNSSYIASTTGNVDLMVPAGFGTRFFTAGGFSASVLSNSFLGGQSGAAFTWQTSDSTGTSGTATFKSGNSSLNNSGVVTIQSGTASSAIRSSGVVYLRSGDAGASSGNVFVRSGESRASGHVNLFSGAATTGTTGHIEMFTGVASGSGSGYISIHTGSEVSPYGSGGIAVITGNGFPSGNLNLGTGNSTFGAGSVSGSVSLMSGTAVNSSGSIGIGSGGASISGALSIRSGNSTSSSGTVSLASGNVSPGGSGDIYINSGNGAVSSGNINIGTGTGATNTGSINITTASAVGTAGDISITTGNAGTGSAGDLFITTGDGTDDARAGHVYITSGYRSFNDISGDVTIRSSRGRGYVKFEQLGQDDPLIYIMMCRSGTRRVDVYCGYEIIT